MHTPARSGRGIAYGIGAYAAYLVVRQLTWTDRGRQRASRNAEKIAAFEADIGIGCEASVQRAALAVPRLVDVLNAGYAAGNVALSVGWLLRLYRRRDPAFRRERTAALLAFGGALPFFAAFPTAPPRTLDGIVDTLAERGWSLDHPVLVKFYNPIAAMPSHHVAFAVVTGFGLAGRARTPLRRTAWRAYPAAVALVVLATGNHFVADVVGGAALGATARRVSR